jgi:hypothetical protein
MAVFDRWQKNGNGRQAIALPHRPPCPGDLPAGAGPAPHISGANKGGGKKTFPRASRRKPMRTPMRRRCQPALRTAEVNRAGAMPTPGRNVLARHGDGACLWVPRRFSRAKPKEGSRGLRATAGVFLFLERGCGPRFTGPDAGSPPPCQQALPPALPCHSQQLPLYARPCFARAAADLGRVAQR